MKAPRRHRLADVHRDENEAALIKLAEQLGAHWWEGPPLDGRIFFRGICLGDVEIKMPEREGTAREYTALQQRYFTWCRLRNIKWHVWRTDSDVLALLGARVSA
jgi:hypothetical protein